MGFNESKPCCDSTRIEKLEARVEELEKQDRRTMSMISDLLTGQDDLIERIERQTDAYNEIYTKTHPAPDADTQAERGRVDYDKGGDVLYVYFNEPEPYYCVEIGDSEKFNVMISTETKQPVGLLVWSVKRWLDSFHATPAPPAEWKPEVDEEVWVKGIVGNIYPNKTNTYIGVYSNSDLKHAWSIIVNPSDLRPVRNSEEE